MYNIVHAMSPTIRTLIPGDEPQLEAFLAQPQHADTSMFLRSNLRTAGLVDLGAPYQGTYVAAFVDDAMVAVAASAWNDMVLVQAPDAAGLPLVVRGAVQASGRAVVGFSGPYRQVVATREALGLAGVKASIDAREELFRLDLAALVVPPALASGEVRCIRPGDEHAALVTAWRVEYCLETLGERDTPELRERCRVDMARLLRDGACFVLLDRDGAVVSYSAFNARLPDCVQIGGVYTPKHLRGRGYARATVAGSLLVARAGGVTRSILFTPETNTPASRAYRAIGYQTVGEYGLFRFPQPMRVARADGRFEP